MIVEARDVHGEPLPVPYTVWLEQLGGGADSVARDVPPDGRAEFEVAPHNSYRVRVVCEGHAEVARNVGGSVADVELSVPVDPSAVVGFRWPEPLPEIPGLTWGPELVEDTTRVAAALNIWAKLWHTNLGMMPAASYVAEVLEVRADRLIVRAAPALRDVLAAAAGGDEPTLDRVDGALHDPPDGYDLGDSYKTKDPHGNAQWTLFEAEDEATAEATGELLADIDIDKARGIGHVFEVLDNALTHRTTDQVDVLALLALQGIDAGWRPLIA